MLLFISQEFAQVIDRCHGRRDRRHMESIVLSRFERWANFRRFCHSSLLSGSGRTPPITLLAFPKAATILGALGLFLRNTFCTLQVLPLSQQNGTVVTAYTAF